MLNHKYQKNYRMNFIAFQHLVSKLILILHFSIDICEASYIHQEACVISCISISPWFSYKAMDNLHDYGESTIRKYTLIVCKVFSCYDGLFGTYIHVLRGHIVASLLSIKFVILLVCLM